jgi:hypothetical protein
MLDSQPRAPKRCLYACVALLSMYADSSATHMLAPCLPSTMRVLLLSLISFRFLYFRRDFDYFRHFFLQTPARRR